MANWISSKLKAAESILQQIDQQAAESLKKGERPLAVDYLEAAGKAGDILPLKDQLKKKNQVDNDYRGKLRSDLSLNVSRSQDNAISASSKPSPSSKSPTLTDSDWTELLGNFNLSFYYHVNSWIVINGYSCPFCRKGVITKQMTAIEEMVASEYN
ncbi:golgin candidate 2-like [Cucumis melo]|uniref:Golgin candidate 2-like n=1 Tax=Cucumis melo TaxID=3656 RepID=A0ABM3KJ62_CUCME|nr:golgin candidate 2-like [Cucumis melo]